MASNTLKQELKQKSEVVANILKLKGLNYDEWQLEKLNEFINNNVSFLLDVVNKKEVKKENNSETLKI